MAAPPLLLDVDGVLNVLSGTRPGDGFHEHVVQGVALWLTPQHGRWLNELSPTFELMWATTWEHDANTHIAPRIGLTKPLPVIEFGMRRAVSAWHWKLPDVNRVIGDERPFAWLDDEFGPADHAWAAERTAQGAPTLLLACDPLVGMTRAHVDHALRWAGEL